MKYIFFGTPEFAAIILEKLIKAGLMPEAVICNPDKPIGRKQIITSPPVKILAEKHNLAVYQPKDKTELLKIIKNLQPDLAIVTAFGMIFPKEVLNVARCGFINVHPSLLPKYRGASPIQTAILNGDKETGVSLFLVDEEIDKGPILVSSRLPLRISDNYEILMRKLADLGAHLLIETLPKYINAEITPLSQDESQATYTKRFSTQDGYIEPSDLEKAEHEGGRIALEIDRKIRALNPEPGAWTVLNGKRTKILEAKIIDEKLKITKIQVEGKKPVEL